MCGAMRLIIALTLVNIVANTCICAHVLGKKMNINSLKQNKGVKIDTFTDELIVDVSNLIKHK